jgi:gluconolactonase
MFRTADYTETQATLWTQMPTQLRRQERSAWGDSNRPGLPTESFLEGPCFDAQGALMVVDIPFGRVLRIDPQGDWQTVCEYEGWPNGLKVLPGGDYLVADYRRGLVRISQATGHATPHLPHRYSEGFRGLNDLHLGPDGSVYFTDQGQTGLHDPTGRVYRLAPDGALHTLLSNVPSPNGLVLAPDGKALFVAVTRDASVWRGALMPDGNLSKVGRFVSFFGATGPDGLAFDAHGNLWVAHPSGQCVWVVAQSGEVMRRVRLPAGAFPTNLAFSHDASTAFITASGLSSIFVAKVS